MGDSIRSSRFIRLADQGTVLALAALLFFVDLFLPWSQGCVSPVVGPAIRRGLLSPMPIVRLCSPVGSGWVGFGTVAGLLAGLLLIWEATRVARVDIGFSAGYRSLITAVLSFGVLLFTAIEVVARLTWMSGGVGSLLYGGTFLWIALALALVIGAGGLVHWGIWEAHAPSAPGFSAGAPPAEPAPAPPRPAPPEPAWPKACPDCGRVNPEDARFCSGCGKSLSPNPRRRSPRPTPPAS
jgi:hypothetical protein